MKLWQKIYIIFFSIFVIAFNLGGISIIERIHSTSLENEVKNGLSKQKGISYILNLGIKDSNFDNKTDINAFISKYVDHYLTRFSEEKISIEILNEMNTAIFSNFKIDIQNRLELKNLDQFERKYIIRNLDSNYYLFVTSELVVNQNKYKLSYIADISDVYFSRNDLYKVFFQLEFWICLVCLIIIYIISKLITQPVDSLIKSTEKISKGNYYEMIEIDTKDELGELADRFNKMSEIIAEKIEELEIENMKQQRFIENLTHELKTPLTSIIGYSNLLRTSKVSDDIFYRSIEYIYKEGKRLEKLSSKMMDLIFMKSDKFEFKNENIIDIVNDVIDMVDLNLKYKHIEILVEVDNYFINVDRALIEIMISNLLDNAIKASNENSKIILRSFENNNKCILEVEDFGIGIKKEDIKNIIEPFYMVDKSRTRKNNGAGLGLSICQKIADIHKAKLKIKSELQKGTIIHIEFD